MTLEELKQKTKHELMEELVSDLKEGRETELTTLLKDYLSIEYHVVRKDITGKDDFNKDFLIGTILDQIALNYNVTPSQIKGKSRGHPLPDARHVYFYISKTYFNNLTLAHLGRVINRKHCTGVHAVKKIKGFLETDKGLEKRIDNILGNIKIKLGSLKNN